jgi:hypothetical protein
MSFELVQLIAKFAPVIAIIAICFAGIIIILLSHRGPSQKDLRLKARKAKGSWMPDYDLLNQLAVAETTERITVDHSQDNLWVD